MHIGLMMECDYRAGKTQEEAFHEAFSTAAHAEEWGFDGVWLAERHFAPPESGRAIPSVVASPLIIATAWTWVSVVVAFPGRTRGMTFPTLRAGNVFGNSLT
jgi:alkanesulfonate monooxygenase SsuD/methylene tetrahydromethanopterin reductase-like flavin-dependent oxidoreductase (luciferase family)